MFEVIHIKVGTTVEFNILNYVEHVVDFMSCGACLQFVFYIIVLSLCLPQYISVHILQRFVP